MARFWARPRSFEGFESCLTLIFIKKQTHLQTTHRSWFQGNGGMGDDDDDNEVNKRRRKKSVKRIFITFSEKSFLKWLRLLFGKNSDTTWAASIFSFLFVKQISWIRSAWDGKVLLFPLTASSERVGCQCLGLMFGKW